MSPGAGRFAPSTTGLAHPGTLLAALLAWLDARSRGQRFCLRLEDLDPARCRPEWARAMPADLAWLGLDWDVCERQSACGARHEAALDHLAARGLLYPCACSRSELRGLGGVPGALGPHYPGTCRGRSLPAGGWRASREPLRLRLPGGGVRVKDESGALLEADPAQNPGDPVVRRRDGAVAYHLASVVDDAASGVDRVVRGRDLAAATPLQVRIQQLLGLETPRYRHHLLLLEPRGAKLAKLHGSVSIEALRPAYDAPALCGVLAHAAGLLPEPAPLRPADLLPDFAWSRVAEADRVLRLRDGALELVRP